MLEILFILIGFALLLVLVTAVSVFMYVAYGHVRSKGYTPPAAASMLATSLAAGIGVAAYWLAAGPTKATNLQIFLYVFYLPMVVAAGVAALAMVSLPARGARTFGERRPGFPFERIGQCVIGLGVLAGAAAVVASVSHHLNFEQLNRALMIVVGFVVPLGLYFIYLARRTQAPSLNAMLEHDTRAVALYLRAFNQESQFFLIGPKRKYGAYASGLGAALAKPDQNVGVTFEGYFAAALSESIGPFVALGSPEDYLAPEGAARLYAKDTDWMQRLEELANRAVCIVVEVGKSANLRWEFEHLKVAGQQTKLFVFTRPEREPGTRLAYAFWGLLWCLKGIEKITWPQFAADLGKMGYQPGDDPGPGSVLTFDANGKAVLLTSEATSPDPFIEPIEHWVQQRERIGKCIPASCATCGRHTFVMATTGSIPAGAECTNCLQKRMRAARSLRERWFESVPGWFFWWFVASLVLSTGTLAFVPHTPWLDEWGNWVATLAFVILVPLPFAVGYLLPDHKAPQARAQDAQSQPRRAAKQRRNR